MPVLHAKGELYNTHTHTPSNSQAPPMLSPSFKVVILNMHPTTLLPSWITIFSPHQDLKEVDRRKKNSYHLLVLLNAPKALS